MRVNKLDNSYSYSITLSAASGIDYLHSAILFKVARIPYQKQGGDIVRHATERWTGDAL